MNAPTKKLNESLSLKGMTQRAINKAKSKRTPRERDIVAMNYIESVCWRVAKQKATILELVQVDREWQRYLAYAGEHEVHDFDSMIINFFSLLISGLEGQECVDRIEAVSDSIRKFKRIGDIANLDFTFEDPERIWEIVLNIETTDKRLFMAQKRW